MISVDKIDIVIVNVKKYWQLEVCKYGLSVIMDDTSKLALGFSKVLQQEIPATRKPL